MIGRSFARHLRGASRRRGAAQPGRPWPLPACARPEAFFSAVQWLVLCVAVIGTRQLGLLILMHDAAHGLLHPHRRVNAGL